MNSSNKQTHKGDIGVRLTDVQEAGMSIARTHIGNCPTLAPGQVGQYKLVVSVPFGHVAFRVESSGGNDFKLHDPCGSEPGNWLLRKNVSIMGHGNGAISVSADEKNSLRVAVITPEGELFYWQASLVCQENKLFLVRQLKRSGTLGKKGDRLFCSSNVRRGILDALAKQDGAMELVPERQVSFEKDPACPRLGFKQGWVEWMDEARQVAGLKVWNGAEVIDVRCPWHHMPKQDGERRCLFEGQLVEVPDIGRPRTRDTKFQWEVIVPVTVTEPTRPLRKDRGNSPAPRRIEKGFSLAVVIGPQQVKKLRPVPVSA